MRTPKSTSLNLLLAVVLVSLSLASANSHQALAAAPLAEIGEGNPKAPIVLHEFVSLTCSHCADFYKETLPAIEQNYVNSGKVRLVVHDFPLDGVALKASALVRCLPAQQALPFIKTLFQNQANWAFVQNPEDQLVRYAGFSGLSPEKAKACLNDKQTMDLITNAQETYQAQYEIHATPTFVANETTIQGARPFDEFANTFESILKKQDKK